MSEWKPIETAAKDPTKALHLGHWNGTRWTWLTHGAWSDGDHAWRDDERIYPTHWREIGEPL